MTDLYQFWRDSLAGKNPAIVNEQLECGFYRMKDTKGGKYVPVAVYPSANGLAVKIGSTIVTNNFAVESWHWYAPNPITEETYRAVAERGENWPDIDEAVASHDATSDLKQQIDAAIVGVKDYAKIDSDDHASRGQTLRALLLKLSKQADDARKAEKEPFLKGGRDVDAKWKPLVDIPADGAAAIRSAMERWETTKLNAAERSGSNMPPPATQVKGAYGKAASVGTYDEVTIMDIDAVFSHFKADVEVVVLLTKLAQKATDNGLSVPGIKLTTKAKIR